jgi:hypothetical protein
MPDSSASKAAAQKTTASSPSQVCFLLVFLLDLVFATMPPPFFFDSISCFLTFAKWTVLAGEKSAAENPRHGSLSNIAGTAAACPLPDGGCG